LLKLGQQLRARARSALRGTTSLQRVRLRVWRALREPTRRLLGQRRALPVGSEGTMLPRARLHRPLARLVGWAPTSPQRARRLVLLARLEGTKPPWRRPRALPVQAASTARALGCPPSPCARAALTRLAGTALAPPAQRALVLRQGQRRSRSASSPLLCRRLCHHPRQSRQKQKQCLMCNRSLSLSPISLSFTPSSLPRSPTHTHTHTHTHNFWHTANSVSDAIANLDANLVGAEKFVSSLSTSFFFHVTLCVVLQPTPRPTQTPTSAPTQQVAMLCSRVFSVATKFFFAFALTL
jgi:hypothetical protein